MEIATVLGFINAAESILTGVAKMRDDLSSDDQATVDAHLASAHGKLTTDLSRVIAKAEAAADA